MTERGEFEHESLPDARSLFVGYRNLLANHGVYEQGDGVAAVKEAFVLDGAVLPLSLQGLVDKIEFVPVFDDRGMPGGDYVTVTLPPNPKGLVRSIQIWQFEGEVFMEALDIFDDDGDISDLLEDDGTQRLLSILSEDHAPTDTELRRLGRILESLQNEYGD